jgi:aryl-alcohol dehydrogenase-like predicted oxidoreductase
MELRKLGATGLRVSLLGMGCNNFGDRLDFEASRNVVHKALDLGVNYFDTADTYGRRGGSEECLGQILGPRRQGVILATKFGLPMTDDAPARNASRRYIMQAVEASLRRLRTDWIDVYQLHFPDSATPIEETLRALDDLIRQGKVRYIGCSNFAAWQIADASWTSRQLRLHGFVLCQNAYNMLLFAQSCEWLKALEAYGIGLVPAYPLAGGLLTGKYRRGQAMPKEWRLGSVEHVNRRFATERNWNLIETLQAFAVVRDMSLHELALSWLTAQKIVASIIAGASNADQLEQNFKAATRVLTTADKAEVDRIISERHD